MDKPRKTIEAEQLDARPEVRQDVMRSTEFRLWRDRLPTVQIDDEEFYLPWGDVPMDEDQIVYHWARSHGLLD